ncbi:MAG: hypothetical protein JO029_13970, partial [Candidatus Eremiobacteraeota bacterium]|nr:hypothetical protein [Candidatus Eremiobacteraeota bacterium]
MKLLRVLLAVAIVAGSASCTRAGETTAPSDRLRIAININPTNLNGILQQNTMESFVDGLIFDNL